MENYNPIYDKSLGVDPETGLEKRKNVYNVRIYGQKREIHVDYEIVLITPTNKIAGVLFRNTMITDDLPVDDGNGGTYQRYTMYEQSQVGQGVKAILQANIDDYPEA